MCLFINIILSLYLASLQGSSEKKAKRKARREKRKVLKKGLQSTEPQDNFMSELPFCLTSPTTWKELGCVCLPAVIFPSQRFNVKTRFHFRAITSIALTSFAELISVCTYLFVVPTPESNQKKRKRKRDGGGRVDSEEDAEGKKKKKKENQRPNYFISIPITNPKVDHCSDVCL